MRWVWLALLVATVAALVAHDPAQPSNVKKIRTPGGQRIRYKETNLCETTPGVKAYSGYIDMDKQSHAYFQFYEARHNPATAPITMWINGGPGSDSLIGVYQELGPCSITANLTEMHNPYAWNTYSNMLFLSQPYGTGFSYSTEVSGGFDPLAQTYDNASWVRHTGRFPDGSSAEEIPTSSSAAVAAWEIIQTFYQLLPALDESVKSREFHLWTESYGGHFGPAFYSTFEYFNERISSNKSSGVALNLASLGIGNGIIDAAHQVSFFPEFAVNNTYGIRAINDTVYNYMKFALNMPNGCRDQLRYCRNVDHSTLAGKSICAQASNICRDSVEGPYYSYSGRGTYDIRKGADDPEPPDYYTRYLNLPHVQNALGVNLNYTEDGSNDVYYAFSRSGDYAYRTYLRALEKLLQSGVRVHLYYGDADYICNWLGGEAVSLVVNYTHAEAFRQSPYEPFVVGEQEYGAVRQYGNFSFLRVYDAGHEVPYYQPRASLEMFRRVITGVDVAKGKTPVGATYRTVGNATKATHTQSTPPLPLETDDTDPKTNHTAEMTGTRDNSTTVENPPGIRLQS